MGTNLKAITNIQRQTDVLSDGHQEIVDQAVSATLAIMVMDSLHQELKERGSDATFIAQAQATLTKLKTQLEAQGARALRVRDEIDHIQNTLKTD